MRRVGARFVLRVAEAQGLRPDETPFRVRLTTREAPRVEAGAFVAVTAGSCRPRSPPCRAAMISRATPFSQGIGGVGSVLGRIEGRAAARAARLAAALDGRGRPGTQCVGAARFAIVGGDEGAVAAAMVTGKRDLLSDKARELIREAGIFHIITISGVQMTLVAGMIFWVVRAAARVFGDARASLSDQEMGGGRRHARRRRL